MEKTFTNTLNTRITPELSTKIDDYMKEYPQMWNNKGHFVRASIVWFINFLGTEKGREFLTRNIDSNIDLSEEI